jgi:murein DD-endopeptidase MepM/ murein hydrolase activator NlpD
VPAEKPMRQALGAPSESAARPTGPVSATPEPTVPAGFHEVASGDTIYNISKRYGVQARVLVAANDLPAPYDIAIGQRLRLPATATIPAPEPAPGLTVVAAIAGLLPTPSSKPLAPPPPRSQALFDWPLRGELVSSFGPKPGGLHNDGINIAASEGTAVRAVESGVVVYVGNELRGYGNLLLLRHADGWMSAYAHVRDIAVNRGQLIRRGQVVARVGRSGRIDRPQLHFELRKGRDAVDPTRYLVPIEGAPRQALSRAARLGVPPDPG